MGYGAPIYIDAHPPEHIIKRMKDKNELETMLGAARFKTYYTAAGNDTEKPVALYRWSTRLAGALHSQLSYFEVLTRNAMNNALQGWNYKKKGCRDWSLEYRCTTCSKRLWGRLENGPGKNLNVEVMDTHARTLRPVTMM